MAITAEQLNVILSARDREFARAMERNQKRVQRFENRTRKSLRGAGRSFDALGRAARTLAPILAAAFSVQAISNMTRSAAQIGRLSDIAGMSVEEFQRFAAATRTVGVEMDRASDIIKDVNDKIGDFLATGGGPMRDFFEQVAPQVGVTADQFARLSGPEALALYVKSLEAANLSQAEMTFYMEAIANDATALLPILRDNASEMRRLGDEAEDAGRILNDDAIEAAKDLETEARDLSDTIRTQLTKAILDNKDELMAVVSFITDTAIPAFSSLIGVLERASGLYDAATGRGDGGGVARPDPSVSREELDAANALGGGDPSNTGLFYVDENGDVQEYGPGAPEIPGITAPAPPPVDLGATVIGDDDKGGSGGGDPLREVEELREAYRDLIGQLDRATQITNDFEDTQDMLNRALATGAINQEQFRAGMQAATAEMQKAKMEASGLGDVMRTVEDSMTDAFMSMVDGTESAKDAFRNMARDVIRELYRVLVVQRLVGSFESGGGGILGAVFGAFGGSTGMASGGAVSAGQPYTVGESGRELFVPSSAGRIMSAPQTERMLTGGGGTIVNQNFTFNGGVTEADLGRALPIFVEEAKRQVLELGQRGGARAGVLG